MRSHPIPVRQRCYATLSALALAAAAIGVSACTDDKDAKPTTTAGAAEVTALPSTQGTQEQPTSTAGGAGTATVEEDGTTSVATGPLGDEVATLPTGGLSEAERAGLMFMREEEKLALDVYSVLGDVWGTQVFANIARAEQTHTDSVKVLLDRYGLTDPATGVAGTFTDPQLQALYDQLVAQGRRSLVDALTVGATIEDVDIADLQARASDNPDIDLVYDSLERGSRNHLRAFVTQLENQGSSYTPSRITQAAYDAIVGSPIERGVR